MDAEVTVDKKGQLQKKKAFYIRFNNGTREIDDPAERQKYIFKPLGITGSDI